MEKVEETSQLRTTYHQRKHIVYLARKEYELLVTIHKPNIEQLKATAIGDTLVHGCFEAAGYIHLMATEQLLAVPIITACGNARLLPDHVCCYQDAVTSSMRN